MWPVRTLQLFDLYCTDKRTIAFRSMVVEAVVTLLTHTRSVIYCGQLKIYKQSLFCRCLIYSKRLKLDSSTLVPSHFCLLTLLILAFRRFLHFHPIFKFLTLILLITNFFLFLFVGSSNLRVAFTVTIFLKFITPT